MTQRSASSSPASQLQSRPASNAGSRAPSVIGDHRSNSRVATPEDDENHDASKAKKPRRLRATIVADVNEVEEKDTRCVSSLGSFSSGSDQCRKSAVSQKSGSLTKAKSMDARQSVASLGRQLALFVGGGEEERRYQIERELLKMPLFEHHPDALIKQVAEQAVWKSFSPENNITVQHQTGHTLILILAGEVAIVVDGDEVGELGAGDCWGETNMLGLDEKHSATLTPTEPTDFCEITHESYLDVLYQWPEEQKAYEQFMTDNRICMADGTLSHTCEIFRGLSNSTLVGIDLSLVRRIYFPGEYILQQGSAGDSLVMIVRGSVDIEINEKIVGADARGVRKSIARGSLQSVQGSAAPRHSVASNILRDQADQPICYGELGLLGMQDSRIASIIATSTCHARILHRSVFMRQLEEHHESLEADVLQDFLAKRYKDSDNDPKPSLQTLKEIPMFQEVGCSDSFLEFLSQHLMDRMFLTGQRIIEENVPDDRCMYILGRGKAAVIKGDVEVAVLESGAVFGEVVCLGLASKRQTTITAEELCYTKVLQQTDMIKGLRQFPEEQEKVLMMAFKRGSGGETVPLKPDGSPDWKTHHARAVIKAAASHPIFGKIGVDFIRRLSDVALDRIYMPGDFIIQEGEKGDSLFIMVSGQAAVYTTQERDGQMKRQSLSEDNPKFNMMRIGMLGAGSISGELAMLGIAQKRSATIEAETICVMWEVTHEKVMPIMDHFPDSRKQFLDSVCSHLEHTVSNCIDSIDLFNNFERKFRMLLGLYCDRKAFFPGEKIFQEGHQGDGLCILNLGMAAQERKAIPIKTCSPGSYFNATIMLGIHKQCFCTLTATHTCHVVVIARASYVQALEQYPSHEVAHDLSKQLQAAEEEFRESIRRLCSRGLLWNKSQAAVADAFQKLYTKVPDEEVLRRSMKIWKRYSLESFRARRGRENRRHAMQDWIQKQRLAVSHRQKGSLRERAVEQELTEPILSSRPPTKANKFSQMSSLYLGSRRDWESMMPVTPGSAASVSKSNDSYSGLPRSPRDARALALDAYSASPRTPRDARAVALGNHFLEEQFGSILIGSRHPLALPWE